MNVILQPSKVCLQPSAFVYALSSSDAPTIGSTIGNRYIGLKIKSQYQFFFNRYLRFIDNRR